ncbi:signal transduction histidine kinase [Stackebrandtia endophytica]|uniref:histidine kinase n=1 Tax=Stackebrandtia endophytica TaxID=1496996 RepID=A0A543ARI7_9ACTN|nr:histidine kinase [Stackebrandtia endophytica]TQL75198.1 signal transduction histidine kinase [Stackebrandtia endophytica]
MVRRTRPGRLTVTDESGIRRWMYREVVVGYESDGETGWFDVWVSKNVSIRRSSLAAAACFLGGLISLHFGAHMVTDVTVPWWLRAIPLLLACIGLVLRRIAPLTALAIGSVGFLADMYFGIGLATAVAYTDNIYSATVRGGRAVPKVLLGTYVGFTLLLGTGMLWLTDLNNAVASTALFAVALVSPVATGMVVREHRERAELERDRAAKIAQLAEVDRRAALAEERNRMARELHDTIANHFSAIAMQSSAVLSRSEMDLDSVRSVVSDIRANSLVGLADMRRTIELLRTSDVGTDSQRHRVSDLTELIDRMSSAGLSVAVEVSGDARELPVTVEFAGYRIVQEALTNALKHGRDALVTIEYDPTCLNLIVFNRLPKEPTGLPGSGRGLLSMRERVTILGGRFHAGPTPDGWRVLAELPIESTEGSP